MKRLITALMLLGSTSAFADHASWSGYRGGYSDSYQFITESEFIHSNTTFTEEGKPAEGFEPATEASERKGIYKGLGLKTSMSTELVRFVRFSAYHLYRDQSSNPADSMRGSEIGGETKLSFWGPVVNLQLGLGLSASRLNHQNVDGSTIYFGSGYAGTVGIERFIASKASVIFTVKAQRETLRPEETDKTTTAESSTMGVGLALLLWLN